jgi:hypothetical protein
MARKPAALARELLRNVPKSRRGKSRRKRKAAQAPEDAAVATAVVDGGENGAAPDLEEENGSSEDGAISEEAHEASAESDAEAAA